MHAPAPRRGEQVAVRVRLDWSCGGGLAVCGVTLTRHEISTVSHGRDAPGAERTSATARGRRTQPRSFWEQNMCRPRGTKRIAAGFDAHPMPAPRGRKGRVGGRWERVNSMRSLWVVALGQACTEQAPLQKLWPAVARPKKKGEELVSSPTAHQSSCQSRDTARKIRHLENWKPLPSR